MVKNDRKLSVLIWYDNSGFLCLSNSCSFLNHLNDNGIEPLITEQGIVNTDASDWLNSVVNDLEIRGASKGKTRDFYQKRKTGKNCPTFWCKNNRKWNVEK